MKQVVIEANNRSTFGKGSTRDGSSEKGTEAKGSDYSRRTLHQVTKIMMQQKMNAQHNQEVQALTQSEWGDDNDVDTIEVSNKGMSSTLVQQPMSA